MRPEAVPVFQAESPDEGAFVSAARNLGFYFCRRSMKDVVVRINAPEAPPPPPPTPPLTPYFLTRRSAPVPCPEAVDKCGGHVPQSV